MKQEDNIIKNEVDNKIQQALSGIEIKLQGTLVVGYEKQKGWYFGVTSAAKKHITEQLAIDLIKEYVNSIK